MSADFGNDATHGSLFYPGNSAGITVAWESYQQYDDKDMLAEHYGAMKKYIEYLLEKNLDPKTGLLIQENPGSWGNLGDWLSPEEGRNNKTLLWEAYFIYDLELMGKIAAALGKKEDAARFNKLYTERRSFFNRTYIEPGTGKTSFQDPAITSSSKQRKTIDTQGSYALPLAFGVVGKENKALTLKN